MPEDHGSSIEDDEQYGALRGEGMSREEAARAGKTSAREAGKRGGAARRYEDWKMEDLEQKARRIGIEGRSKMNRDELIDALRNH